MEIEFTNEDGKTYWLPDDLPDDITRAEMRDMAIPIEIKLATDELNRLKEDLAMCQYPDDETLIEWAKQNHPTAARKALLKQQVDALNQQLEDWKK